MSTDTLIVRGAREHNLKNISVTIPKNKLTVITGLSGSGKSTLAFDTIYAEGQRRYVESLSAYARQFLGLMQKPDVDSIEGLSPAISIEQKTTSKNPRSTVGTVTEVYDYLRLLFARVGVAHCPICDTPIQPQTTEDILNIISQFEQKTKVIILAPIIRDKKGTHEQVFVDMKQKGFTKVEVNSIMYQIEDVPQLERYKKHTINVVIDRISYTQSEECKTRLTDAIEQATTFGNHMVIVRQILANDKHKDFICNKKGGCLEHPEVEFEELQPKLFSFNSPFGACPDCHGIGQKHTFDPSLLIDHEKSLAQGCVKTFAGHIDGWRKTQLLTFAKYYNIDIFAPFKSLSDKHKHMILHGDPNQSISGREYGEQYWQKDAFEGVLPLHERLYTNSESDKRREKYEQYMIDTPCPTCNGARLKPQSLSVYINGKNIIQVTDMSIKECQKWFLALELTPTQQFIAKQIVKEINERLSFLVNVGLEYLTLSRSAGTLSGGEAQRIRLATQIGSNLTGVLYVLDEPSIGLHQRDNEKLIGTLERLRDLGNTVIVVEHDEDTMNTADHLIDIGPGAGIHGGEIVYAGDPKKIPNTSITGMYLHKKKQISIPKKRRKSKKKLSLIDAHEHNLKHISVDIPLGVFCTITGVSGSGKSTLITETLYKALHNHLYKSHLPVGKYKSIEGLEHIDKIIDIDQSPIGRTPRSNPATYTNVFTDIRELFSNTKESRERGYGPGRFSFNVSGGRCEACQGDGLIKIEMNFLPDVYVQCETCKGKRYNEQTLEVKYKGKDIADVLDMSVEQALSFFEHIPKIKHKLQYLFDVGLGYIKLGQSATTLSGGEAQRIKLTAELAKRATGKTIYILDEPTTGLHFEDVNKLLEVLNRLVEKGNSIIVVEHNLDVIKSSDWVIDLGPEGGDGGGQIIAQGTPEDIVKVKKSYTGKFLKDVLS